MQSPEGLAERAKVAIVEKTIGTVSPDKSTVMFKIFVLMRPLYINLLKELKYQNL